MGALKRYNDVKAAKALAKLAERKTGVTKSEAFAAKICGSMYEWARALGRAKEEHGLVCLKAGVHARYVIPQAKKAVAA